MSLFTDSIGDWMGQALILGSPLIAQIIYIAPIQLPEEKTKNLYYMGALAFITYAWVAQLEFRYYTPILFVEYALLTVLATTIYNGRYPIKEAICLAFLTVFLNSYYWELPLHIIDYVLSFPNYDLTVVLPQLWRLYPALFFHQNFTFNEDSRRTLIIGLTISSMVTVFTVLYSYYYTAIGLAAWTILRFVCLIFLVKTIVEAEKKT